jgi:hypothetical protein
MKQYIVHVEDGRIVDFDIRYHRQIDLIEAPPANPFNAPANPFNAAANPFNAAANPFNAAANPFNAPANVFNGPINVFNAPPVEEGILCRTCFKKKTDVYARIPCGHVYCTACTQAARTRECPSCKVNSENILRLYI